VLRLLDMNLNRAAEGLRTLEDIARVVRKDSSASGWLKSLRHQLGELADMLPRLDRLAARSVVGDVGTGMTEASEQRREDWQSLVIAASERVTQSLRVIEEASKGEFGQVSAACKRLRYQAYDRLSQVERRLAEPGSGFPAPCLYLLVDCSLPVTEFSERLSQLAASGVGLFQIRDKTAESLELLQYCRSAVEAVGSERVIVNDRVDIALACGAGGVHVGQEDLPIELVQKLAGGKLWIGVSTHDLDQARRAQAAGADYIGCGPTFPSTTKQFAEYAGLDFLRQIAAEIELPAYAIGGIHSENVQQVRRSGFGRVAVSSAVWSAVDPPAEAGRLLSCLRSAEPSTNAG
jgi:thiamine-phosphate pyrophosphorylase